MALALVDVTARRGWGKRSLEEAARMVSGDCGSWRALFPRGARDAIWFISEVSDASMKAAFSDRAAPGMSTVIGERFEQNSTLKGFVRNVMFFDFAHPFQALARMQRTARVMMECLPYERRSTNAATISALNLLYTIIVFVWLFDQSATQERTRRTTRALMGILRL